MLADGLSQVAALDYAQRAARALREGRTDPAFARHGVERAALNRYARWRDTALAEHVGPVVQILAQHSMREYVGNLRRGSLVPPYPDKVIPRRGLPRLVMTEHGGFRHEPGPIEYMPTERWTLHVPRVDCPPHVDPCQDCAPIELTDDQLSALASAIESIWGHKDFARLPADVPLFGRPATLSGRLDPRPGRLSALLPPGALANELTSRFGYHIENDASTFVQHVLLNVPDVVVLDLQIAGQHREAILRAIDAALARNAGA